MLHPIHRVCSFEIVDAYTLRVRFDDNTEQVINFQPVLAGELYGPLRDLSVFNRVQIDPEVHTLVSCCRLALSDGLSPPHKGLVVCPLGSLGFLLLRGLSPMVSLSLPD